LGPGADSAAQCLDAFRNAATPEGGRSTGPIAQGRASWLFAGSLRAGKRAATIMCLVHSARINGHGPSAYLKEVLRLLPTQPTSRVEELLPHRWEQTPAMRSPTETRETR
jgi:hypothetical protein